MKKATETRQAAEQALSDPAFDLRLVRSVLNFVGGQHQRDAFGWVLDVQRDRARRLGFKPESITWKVLEAHEIAALKKDKRLERDMTDWDHIGADNLRWRFRACYTGLWGADRPGGSRKFDAALDSWYTEQLDTMQIVTRWRMSGGRLEAVSIPRLETVERCVFYVVGLAMLDQHGLKRGIKHCPYKRKPTDAPHFFLDLPTTKREFCSTKHAAAVRKRREREGAAARKHK